MGRCSAASDASRGEAQTALDAVLAEGAVPGLEEADARVYTYTFETGGKPERDSDSVIDRITNRVTNTLRITNPPHYAIVAAAAGGRPGRAGAGRAGADRPRPTRTRRRSRPCSCATSASAACRPR